MNPRILCVILAVAALLSGSPVRADEKAQALIKEVAAATKAAKTLSADITMSQSFNGQSMKATGAIKLRKPNKALIKLGAPFSQTVASDGRDVITFMETANQYMKEKADPKGANIQVMFAFPAAAFFTADGNSLGIRYLKTANATYAGTEKRGDIEYRVLQVIEGEKNVFRLYVAPNKLITGASIEIKQADGSAKLDAFLSKVKINEEISESAFVFALPKTAKLYEPPSYDAKLLAAGTEAPPFELKSPIDSSPISLGKSLDKKKIVLVNFWFRN